MRSLPLSVDPDQKAPILGVAVCVADDGIECDSLSPPRTPIYDLVTPGQPDVLSHAPAPKVGGNPEPLETFDCVYEPNGIVAGVPEEEFHQNARSSHRIRS